MNEEKPSCGNCGTIWCTHYGDMVYVHQLPCDGKDWTLKSDRKCPKCLKQMIQSGSSKHIESEWTCPKCGLIIRLCPMCGEKMPDDLSEFILYRCKCGYVTVLDEKVNE